MNHKRQHYELGAILLVVFAMLTSCGAARKAKKDLLYLHQGTLDTVQNYQVNLIEPTIQPGDILSITVYSDNPEASALYNQQQRRLSTSGGNTGVGQQGLPQQAEGYLVDQKGNLHFQAFGVMNVQGLTKEQLSIQIVEKLKPVLMNPHVDIRFLNFKITVIGEVNRPGVYSIPGDKVSLLELLGLAGDMTVYGRRDNVLIIREKDGKRAFGRIDLRKSDIFTSPYFNLQQNDVILVEANPKKPGVNEQVASRNLTIATAIASMVSVVAIVINVLK